MEAILHRARFDWSEVVDGVIRLPAMTGVAPSVTLNVEITNAPQNGCLLAYFKWIVTSGYGTAINIFFTLNGSPLMTEDAGQLQFQTVAADGTEVTLPVRITWTDGVAVADPYDSISPP